jgi:hypothetical protein
LVARGLRVEELVSHEVVIAQNVRVAHPSSRCLTPSLMRWHPCAAGHC